MATNGFIDEIPECPLCLEPLGLDDINFYPCGCRYQICRFCWHRIRTDENGLCPHCREVYPENPAEYTPPTAEQLAKLKTEKKQKEVSKRQRVVESREKLASVRVVQRNLVFVIGLSPRLADPEVLKRNEYFGKYGKIYKVVINNHTIYNGAQGPSVSAYVTYCRNEDASKAIAAVNNAFIDGRSLKASFGTTKYCTSFLKGTLCTKPDCMYLHELGDDQASFTKEDMQLGKHQVFENATLASLLPTPVEGSGKDNAPSVPAEGGVKIKHTILPRAAKDTVHADIAESALPATAHWASNQKNVTSSESPTQQQDQSHSHSKHSDSSSTSKQVSSARNVGTSRGHPSRGSGTEQSNHSHSRHSGSLKRGQVSQKHNVGEETLKSNSRPGSVSPNTQKSAYSRTLDPAKGTGKRERDGISIRTTVSNHSRGSSITKSMTPNLSPHSTLSTSSSSGSLRQEAEYTPPSIPTSSSGGATGEDHRAAFDKEEEGSQGEVNEGGVARKGSGLSESEWSSGTADSSSNVVLEQLETIHLSKSEGSFSPELQRTTSHSHSSDTANQAPPTKGVVSGTLNVDSTLSISSPPGLSKSRSQPLPSGCKHSDVVCRKLDLGTSVNPSTVSASMEDMGAGQQQAGSRMLGQQFLGRDGGGGGGDGSKGGSGSVEQRAATGAVSSSSDVLSSLASAGSNHFGSLGVNWSQPPRAPINPYLGMFPAALTSIPASMNPYPSQLPFSSSSSQPTPSSHTLPHPHPTLTPSSSSATNHTPSSLLAAAMPPKENSQNRKQVDDGDELGFDPWDVSQQGLADLMETEAEQKQAQPHPLTTPSDPPSSCTSSGSRSTTATPAKVLNGFNTPHLNHQHSAHASSSLYKHWPHPPSSSSSSASPAAGGVAGGGSGTGGSESVQDEFRALFPNVNISFGGSNLPKSKSEKVSPLDQALDASNPSSLPSYLPAHLLNFAVYPSALQGGGARGHAHLGGAAGGSSQGGKGLYSTQPASSSDSSQISSSGATLSSNSLSNSFLGHSQPGFPASCFRVKGHTEGGSGSNAVVGSSSTTSSSELLDSAAANSYSSCLGHTWPDLGITLGQGQASSSSSSSKSPLMPDLGTTVGPSPSQKTAESAGDVGTGGTSKSSSVPGPVATEVGAATVTDSDVWKASGGSSGTAVTSSGTSVSMATSPSVPPPPPGFTKPAHTDAVTSSNMPVSMATQAATSTSSAKPTVFTNSKGQPIPAHLLQSWAQLRNFAALTPAQQQQQLLLARNAAAAAATTNATPTPTQQLTLQQQLLAQQYFFQQALLRNPVYAAQSIRMAQQFQQAALLQKQQQLLAAGLNPTAVGTSTGVPTAVSRGNPNSVAMATSLAQGSSKLLVSMAGGGGGLGSVGNGGSAPSSNLPTTTATVIHSTVSAINTSATATGPLNSSRTVAGGRTVRQNGGGGGVKGQSASGGRNSASRGGSFSSGHSKGSSQVSGGSSHASSVNSKGGGGEKHNSSSRNSKNPSRPKNGVGGGAGHHSSANNVDRKSRQKSSK